MQKLKGFLRQLWRITEAVIKGKSESFIPSIVCFILVNPSYDVFYSVS